MPGNCGERAGWLMHSGSLRVRGDAGDYLGSSHERRQDCCKRTGRKEGGMAHERRYNYGERFWPRGCGWSPGTGIASGRSPARTGTGRFFRMPSLSISQTPGEFPFQNYPSLWTQQTLDRGPLYLENLFDHLIVHYIFCPRSLERPASWLWRH